MKAVPSAPRLRRRVAAGVLAAAAAPAAAQPTLPGAAAPPAPPVAASADAAAALPLWEAGVFAGVGSQQAYPGSRESVRGALLLPYLIYRGPLLRAERGSVGLRALRTSTTELDIGVAAAFGSSAEQGAARRGMPDIGTLVEIGPRLRIDLGAAPAGGRWRAELPLRAVLDLDDGLASRGYSFSPTVGWSRGDAGGSVALGVGAVFGSETLAETFYGVEPVYRTPTRRAHDARAGLIAWRLSGSVSTTLARDWRLFGYARVDSVAGAANRRSPLVETTTGGSVGIGVAWTGWRSARLAAD